MSKSDIPVFKTLDFYSYPDQQVDRYKALFDSFKSIFKATPDFISRSPGRVNLIGEHIDYSYFSVLPLAIDVDFVIAVKSRADSREIHLKNLSNEFAEKKFELPEDGSLISIDSKISDWSNYFKCGLLVAHLFILEHYPERKGKPLKGLQVIADGTVPIGGGLSSSAAFACSVALACLKVNDIEESLLTRENLSKICVVSEKYVGVNTGGMDQTASIYDIPVFKTLDFYSYPDQQVDRYKALFDSFKSIFKATPDFISRSPGRVNLIGEHIDYSYFSVLPLAIDVDFVIAVKSRADSREIHLKNLSNEFAEKKFELPEDGSLISIDSKISDWSNYFKCGLLVAHLFILEHYPERKGKPLKGLQVIADGTVPIGGGLSSSAAFACSVALACLKVNDIEESLLTRENLSKICVVSEKYVGVNTGGMDQTASIYGERDHALYVQFKPKLSCTAFKFPDTKPPISFLIANTLVVSNKHETAPRNYNLRVVEVCSAAEFLARSYGVNDILKQDSGLSTGTLSSFMDAYYAKYHNSPPWNGDASEGKKRLNKMLELVEKTFELKDEGYTLEQAASGIGLSVEGYKEKFLSKNTVIFDKLQLYKRAKHTYSEELRVLDALFLLESKPSDSLEFFTKFGELMDESQKSCDSNYGCSCSEIDEVCSIARAAGSTGSRLTGAGWGGCTVHLIPSDKVSTVEKALIEKYYKKKFPTITEAELKEAIVISKPACGSSLYVGGEDGLKYSK
ncbi:hypothetical protein PACTADRAFT_35911 [Pachysolen tannophilus NRRL Y-2460]|uniref:Galactokinase n=1 Tax=Pachysolen tannophilus NRRL Y-2460 TaxID=669874 RepID=A0A1E4TNJ0_PACTA|nr:hypothetical protein PACTADRAFT_35911 [Pachysolen tannophilus NRRL Y-2460]